MKIAITSRGTQLTDEVDPRFGRAAYVIVVDPDTMEFEAIDNTTNVNAMKGAGIQAATMVSECGAEVLMTGYCGPKAFQTIEAAGVKVISDISGTVEQAIASFKTGTLTYTTAANAEAHW